MPLREAGDSRDTAGLTRPASSWPHKADNDPLGKEAADNSEPCGDPGSAVYALEGRPVLPTWGHPRDVTRPVG